MSSGPATSLPSDEAGAWDLARLLDQADIAERRLLLQQAVDHGGPGRNPWLEFLAPLLAPEASPGDPSGPSVSEAVRAAERMGYTREQAKALVGRFSALDAVQQSWRHWTRVGDRNELRLRLEVLGECRHVDPELVPFLLFFFRASDHVLYQAAAVTIGRHLLSTPTLWDQVERFAASRGLRLDQPLVLNGARNRRRLLLVMAAALAGAHASSSDLQDSRLPHLPFVPPGEPGAAGLLEVARTPADLNAWLRALHLLWSSPQTRGRVAPLVEQALACLVELPDHLVDRRVLRDLGIILVSYYGDRVQEGAAGEAGDRWWALLAREMDRINALGEADFGHRVAGLLRLEEVTRTLAFLDGSAGTAAVARLQTRLSGDDRFFLLLRALTWARRSQRALPSWAPEAAAALETASADVLSPWLRASWAASVSSVSMEGRPSGLLARADQPGHPELLDQLLSNMETEGRWLSLDTPTRALIMLLLLDETQYVGYPEQQLRAFLLRHQLLPATVARQAALSSSTGVAAVVLRALAWEQDGAEAYLDSQLLHQIQDVRTLLALLPSHQDSPLLSILADAFEHQLRWRLQWDPDFDPFLFLYQTTVRDPHPIFLVHLEQVVRDRLYQRPTSEEVPVHEWASMLLQEARVLAGGALPDGADPEGEASGEQPATPNPPRGSRSAGLLNRVRLRLEALEEDRAGLRWRIHALTDLLAEAGPDSAQRGSTLVGLLRALHLAQQPLLQSGYPAWSNLTLQELERRLQEMVAGLESHAAALMPESWDAAETLGEAVTYLRGSFQDIRALLVPALPMAEEIRFRSILERLEADLDHWLQAVGRVQQAWSEYAAGPVAVDLHAWDHLLTVVSEAWTPPERMDVIQRVWTALRHRVESAVGPTDSWTAARRLLDWSVEPSPYSLWSQEEQGRWRGQSLALFRDILQQAMTACWEGRVVQLVTDSRYRSLRRHSDLASHLEDARPWCLDRYRALTALQVQKDVSAVMGRPAPNILGGLVAFFFHFSPVWIGLLVGGFLVLDFGDAWTAMAEIGDVRGIAATFLLGLAGTFLYLLTDLRRKSRASPDEMAFRRWGFYLVRVVGFAAVCLIYTVCATTTLWFLLSGTDEVVHGPGAIGQIAAWSGFTLLFGTFFGLIAKEL